MKRVARTIKNLLDVSPTIIIRLVSALPCYSKINDSDDTSGSIRLDPIYSPSSWGPGWVNIKPAEEYNEAIRDTYGGGR